MEPPPADNFTFASDGVWLSEFRLPPGDPSWSQVSRTTDLATLIAFPRSSVAISHERRSEVVADSLSAVVYGPGQAYRRRLIDGRGDDCTVMAITDGAAAAAAADPYASASDQGTQRLPFVAAPVGHEEFVALQRIRIALETGAALADRDAIREDLLWILSTVLRNGYSLARGKKLATRSATWVEHQSVAAAVRERLGRNLAASPSLDELSEHTASSPFHLARLFREVTGQSIHAYLTALRLRASLAPIADGVRLADVAQQLGFSSHAHLTDRFTRAYGVSPAQWRTQLQAGGRQTRTIMEARPRRAFIA